MRMHQHLHEFDPDDEVGGGSESDAAAALFNGDDGGAEAAADPAAEAGAGDEATGEAGEAPSTPEPAAAAWALSEDEFLAQQEQIQALTQYITARDAEQNAPATGEAPEMPDVLDPDYNEKLAAYFEHKLAERDQVWQERFNSVAPVVQSVQAKEAAAQKESLIDAIDVDGFEKDKPEFREGAEFFAVGMIDQVKAELGLPLHEPSARAAQVALQRGAERFTAFAKAQREAGKQAYIEHMKSLEGAPTDLSPSGGAREGASDAENEEEAVRRLLARATS